MKWGLITSLAAGLALVCPTLARAEDPEYTKNIFGFGTGNRGRGSLFYGKRFNTLGIQLGMYNDINLDSNQIHDGPGPNDTQYLGGYRCDPGFGADLLFFPETDRQSIYFGLGLYYQGIREVGRSSSTGLLYDYGARNIWLTGVSVGLRASVSNNSDFGMGYHNLLGWNISFSMRY